MPPSLLPSFQDFAYTSPCLPPCCTGWKELLSLAERVEYRKGEDLLGSIGSEMLFYYVESGSCQTALNMMDGTVEHIFIMPPGTLAGLPLTIGGCMLPGKALTCRQTGVFWRFRQSLWTEAFVAAHPRQAMECAKMLAVSTLTMANLRILSNSTTERGLARFLCGMVHTQGSCRLVPICSITELAGMFGTHRVNLSRIIGGLVDRGILARYDRDCIEIRDPDALLALAKGDQVI